MIARRRKWKKLKSVTRVSRPKTWMVFLTRFFSFKRNAQSIKFRCRLESLIPFFFFSYGFIFHWLRTLSLFAFRDLKIFQVSKRASHPVVTIHFFSFLRYLAKRVRIQLQLEKVRVYKLNYHSLRLSLCEIGCEQTATSTCISISCKYFPCKFSYFIQIHNSRERNAFWKT